MVLSGIHPGASIHSVSRPAAERQHVRRRGTVIHKAQYVHTNAVARDFRALAQFYEKVFGCIPVPPERNYSGPELESGTGIPGAALRGLHLRLPGVGADGPTLEVFQYSNSASNGSPPARPNGFRSHRICRAIGAFRSGRGTCRRRFQRGRYRHIGGIT